MNAGPIDLLMMLEPPAGTGRKSGDRQDADGQAWQMAMQAALAGRPHAMQPAASAAHVVTSASLREIPPLSERAPMPPMFAGSAVQGAALGPVRLAGEAVLPHAGSSPDAPEPPQDAAVPRAPCARAAGAQREHARAQPPVPVASASAPTRPQAAAAVHTSLAAAVRPGGVVDIRWTPHTAGADDVERAVRTERSDGTRTADPTAPTAGDPRNAVPAPSEPIRLHVDWTAEGARLWLALDAPVLERAADIAAQVRRWMGAQGVRVVSLSCNGSPLDAEPAVQLSPDTETHPITSRRNDVH